MDSREVAQNQSWASSGPKGHVIFSMKSNWMSKAFLLRLCSWRSLSWCTSHSREEASPWSACSVLSAAPSFQHQHAVGTAQEALLLRHGSAVKLHELFWSPLTPQKSWHTPRIGALTPPTKSTPWSHNCRFHTSHRQNSRQNSRVCFVVCFEGLFRGMFRGSVSSKSNFPVLFKVGHPKKNKPIYIYMLAPPPKPTFCLDTCIGKSRCRFADIAGKDSRCTNWMWYKSGIKSWLKIKKGCLKKNKHKLTWWWTKKDNCKWWIERK